MQVTPPHDATELAAAFLQTGITVGVAVVCVFLYARYRRPYFAIWALAWTIYAVRLGAIISFLVSEQRLWLYWHQVLAGWTALAFLWAAVSFSQQSQWRRSYWLLVAFPPVWSYLAIYRLDNFLLAAGTAVLFLSVATAWTGVVLWRHHRRIGSQPAAFTAMAFFLWSLHRLDYPFLRARGAWNPWGYYLDIVFELAIGAGILLIVLEDQQRGISVLSKMSGDLQTGRKESELLDALLARPLTLPAVTGSAMYRFSDGVFGKGAGACSLWEGNPPTGAAGDALERLRELGTPQVFPGTSGPDGEGNNHPFAAALPVFRGDRLEGALVVVGNVRDPFAVLDTPFLVALGHQVGAALANAELHDALEERTAELERLASRMVHQHETERLRLSRELHDESAQVFAAVKLQLGVVRESAAPEHQAALDRAEELVGTGIRSIRAAARELRPALLEDLGLIPALHALAADFGEKSGLPVSTDLAEEVGTLDTMSELALYRSLQEGLSNIARHARGASRVDVRLALTDSALALEIRDDGAASRTSPPGEVQTGTGLIGMRERISALGGTVTLNRSAGGAALRVSIPLGNPNRGAGT
ncbi:MAG: sensor histidine kinase [Gemmatimonadota bacterium]